MRKQSLPEKSQSKTGKKQKNLYLSDQARQLLAHFATNMGISETAVIELLIREKAAREKVTLATASTNNTEVAAGVA